MVRKRSLSPTALAANLRRLAEHLKALAARQSSPPAQRHIQLRYVPFLQELSKRQGFCDDLAALDISSDMPYREVQALLIPLLQKYQFPSVHPYSLLDWADLLASARLALFNLPNSLGSSRRSPLGELIEVQFVFTGSIEQIARLPDRLPIGQIVSFQIRPGRTRRQAKELLAAVCRRPLQRFLRRVRPLAREVIGASVDVRLLTFSHRPGRRVRNESDSDMITIRMPNPLYDASLAANFSVSLTKGRRSDNMLEEIVSRLVPALEDVAAYTSAQGRPPDASNDARWWALTVLDGLTVEQIAQRETDDYERAIDLEETIGRILRRLRMRARTK